MSRVVPGFSIQGSGGADFRAFRHQLKCSYPYQNTLYSNRPRSEIGAQLGSTGTVARYLMAQICMSSAGVVVGTRITSRFLPMDAVMCAWCRALTGKPRIAASIRTFRWVRGSDAQSFVPSVSCGRRPVEGRSRLTKAFRTRTSFRIRHVDTRFQRLFNARK